MKLTGLLVVGLGLSTACGAKSTSTEACQGAEACVCYPNNTCDKGLTCLSDRCVDADPKDDVPANSANPAANSAKPSASGPANTNGPTTPISGNTANPAPANSQKPVATSGPLQGDTGECQRELEWAVGCAVDNESRFQSCDQTNATRVCQAGCFDAYTCNDYDKMKAGERNELASCVGSCGLTSSAEPSCANASAKRFICDITVEYECSDTVAVDRCYNQCYLDYDCKYIFKTPLGEDVNPFENCYNACEATGGSATTEFSVGDKGYVTTETWQGYAWTATDTGSGTTVSPADFATTTAGGSLCASGIVAATADYSGVAMLGFALNQAEGDPAPAASTWVPISNGLAYDVTNNSSAPVRIQIQAAGGDTDPEKRWCANIAGGSGILRWIDFNTRCWDDLGEVYDARTALESVMLLIPGDQFDIEYDVCLNAIVAN